MTAERLVAIITRHLPHQPARALELLRNVQCAAQRQTLGRLIAQTWARQDINAAWSAVSRSPLNAAEKQLMFNELWG